MEEDKLNLEDKEMWLTHDLKIVLQEVYDHYRSVKLQNEHLHKENERLKSDQYRDEELAEMKKKYEKMHEDYYRGFPITKEDEEKIAKWMDTVIGKKPERMRMNSARFHYEFYPTPLGVSGVIVDSITGKKFEFQEIG